MSELKKLVTSLSTLCDMCASVLSEMSKILRVLSDVLTESVESTPSRKVEKYYSIREASKILSISEVTLRRLIKAKKIKSVRLGRKILIPSSEISCLSKES